MKTTIEIPDELFRRSKATAALRGESLKEFVTQAIRERLARQGGVGPTSRGWRSVFGRASQQAVNGVDAVVAAELETVDPDDWQ